jgi:hypothetical protein
MPRNSGWPSRKVWISERSLFWKLDSMRSSSTARGVRFCASSTTSSARLPWRVAAIRKSSRFFSSATWQAFVLQPERGGHAAQRVVGVELGRHQLRGHQVVGLELAKQVAHQRGLAGADFAGDDDEALAERQAVIQIRHRPLVPLGAEEETRVGIELKRLGAKAVIVFVHEQSVISE